MNGIHEGEHIHVTVNFTEMIDKFIYTILLVTLTLQAFSTHFFDVGREMIYVITAHAPIICVPYNHILIYPWGIHYNSPEGQFCL